jgi:hypothetical protein
MGKKVFLGPGPDCPRCAGPSKLYRKSKNNPKSRISAYCENPDCITKAFPPETRKHASLRVKMGEGPPCNRCNQITTAWKHSDEWKPQNGRSYYQYWYECRNGTCLTTLVMPPEAYVKGNARRK